MANYTIPRTTNKQTNINNKEIKNTKETFTIYPIQLNIPMNQAQQNKWTHNWKPKTYSKILTPKKIRHDEFNNNNNIKATLTRELGTGTEYTNYTSTYIIQIMDRKAKNKNYNPNYKCKKPYCPCYTQHKTKPKPNTCRKNQKYHPSRKTILKITIKQNPTQQLQYSLNNTNQPYNNYNCKIHKEKNKLKSLYWYENR